MRNLRLLDAFRDCSPRVVALYGDAGDHASGVFRIASPTGGQPLTVIASTGDGWDHVSVSLPNRCPNWPEMEHVKRLFFREDETAMQLHVPPSDHISIHPNCLHLWRPISGEIPRPPGWMVGPSQGSRVADALKRAIDRRLEKPAGYWGGTPNGGTR